MAVFEVFTSSISDDLPARLLLVSFFLVAPYVFYRWILLPNPIPGIPYNKAAAKRLLGDMPALRSDPEGLAQWCSKQLSTLETPICQALMGPDLIQKPLVLVADVQEVRDVLLGRSDFDRSAYISNRLPLLGDFHLNMKTTEEWKLARQWSKDLLTPQFLNAVAIPGMEIATHRLIELWEAKGLLSNGRPFDMDRDVKGLSIDIILDFYFGEDMTDSILAREVQYVKQLDSSRLMVGKNDEVIFPRAKLHEFCEGLLDISHRISSLYATPWPPALAAWWTRSISPHFRNAFAAKEVFVRKLLHLAVGRTRGGKESDIKSGLDKMVWREEKAATKTGRRPMYGTQAMVDEIYGGLVGGQHTTSAAIVWILKYLTEYPGTQVRLRRDLHAVFTEATAEGRLPTAFEIVAAVNKLPYLRAVIEETMRLRQAMLVPRDATRDTELLGYKIPKGTVVLLVSQGPDPTTLKSINNKPMHASRQYPGKGTKDMKAFDPDRWLAQKDSGDVEFDGTSYPQLAFGGGIRGCWGRKVAELEMQIVTVLLIWKFDFLEVPAALASHSATYDITYRAHDGYMNVKTRNL